MNARAIEPATMRAVHDRAVGCEPGSRVTWLQAIRISAGLWLFVALIFLPLIAARHVGDGWQPIALDCLTFLVSLMLSMPLFALFRATACWRVSNRIVAWAAGVLALTAAQLAFDIGFQGWVAANLTTSLEALPVNTMRIMQSGLNYALVFSVNLALFQLGLARARTLAQERKIAAIVTSAQQAQIAALRFQINPHFLFNTLNAISSLIVARRNEDAEAIVNQLSTFLRSTATIDAHDTISLEEEFGFVERYLEIEGVRFGDRLAAEIDYTPEAGRVALPALIVQTIVMCAVDFAVSLTRQQVALSIGATVQEGRLLVTVGAALPPGLIETTIDLDRELDSAQARLAARYGQDADLWREVTADRFDVTISIPGQ